VRIIAAQTADLPAEDVAKADVVLAAAGQVRNPAGLRDFARRPVARLDPQAAARKKERGRRAAYVRAYHARLPARPRHPGPAELPRFGLLDEQDTTGLLGAAGQDPATRWCLTVTGPDGTAAAHACIPGRRTLADTTSAAVTARLSPHRANHNDTGCREADASRTALRISLPAAA
jgi:hypothetical protein